MPEAVFLWHLHPVMSALKAIILGGIGALCLAAAAPALPHDDADSASPIPPSSVDGRFSAMTVVPQSFAPAMATLRPLSRDQGRGLALAGHRPFARPLAMVRYPVVVQTGAGLRPQLRHDLPEARWDSRADADTWTRAVLSAINGQSHDLSDILPRDIARWCPAYAQNPAYLRDAFWVGMISALARHESMMDPRAVGGGGQWYGLLQIFPPTARHFGCAATTGEELMNPTANLACAARIMTTTVRRDQAVAVLDGRWRGVAADWGPMTESDKRAEMMAWTRSQDYCVIRDAQLRPEARPAALTVEAPATQPIRPMVRPWRGIPARAPYAIARL